MNNGGEAADQMVREALQFSEVAIKLTALGFKNSLAIALAYAKENPKVRGKTSLDRLLREGKEMKIIPLQTKDLAQFKAYAKQYGVLFASIKDKSAQGETVVLLSKGEIDSKKVRVEFSLEDMDMSGFQKGATYEQIKAYVLEHTGLKVSSLYISQIKRKCGLDVGQNYNLSKKEDAKVPKCPPEKEAAIRDALKYFQMI